MILIFSYFKLGKEKIIFHAVVIFLRHTLFPHNWIAIFLTHITCFIKPKELLWKRYIITKTDLACCLLPLNSLSCRGEWGWTGGNLFFQCNLSTKDLLMLFFKRQKVAEHVFNTLYFYQKISKFRFRFYWHFHFFLKFWITDGRGVSPDNGIFCPFSCTYISEKNAKTLILKREI